MKRAKLVRVKKLVESLERLSGKKVGLKESSPKMFTYSTVTWSVEDYKRVLDAANKVGVSFKIEKEKGDSKTIFKMLASEDIEPKIRKIEAMLPVVFYKKDQTGNEVDFRDERVDKLNKIQASKAAEAKRDTSKVRSFEVEIEIYERFGGGNKKRLKGTAIDLFDLAKKLETKGYDIEYYLGELDHYMTDKEIIDELGMSNGDGGDYFTIFEIIGGKKKLLIGGDKDEFDNDDF